MDGNRFDNLVRKLAEPQTRRRTLKTLAAGISASFATAVGLSETDAAKTCRGTDVVCRKNADCCTNQCSAPDAFGRRKCKCTLASDCPIPENGCLDPICSNGSCGTVNACSGVEVCFQGGCCTPVAEDVTCLNVCGNQVNNCGQTVDCGPCCLPGGSGCSLNSDCCSGYCILGTCQGVAAGNGSVCDETADCESGLFCCASTCRQCCQPSDCPGTDTECQTRTCISNSCGVSNTAAGVATTDQSTGDCKKNVCDGSGGITTENDDTDVPVSTGECTTGKCTNGVPSQTPVTLGQECSTGFCNFAGLCAECQFNTNCPDGHVCCSSVCQISNNESCGCEELVCGFGTACHDNDECIDVLSDDLNCGADGHQCEDNFSCCDGVCCANPNHENSVCICNDCLSTCNFGEVCCSGTCCTEESAVYSLSSCTCN